MAATALLWGCGLLCGCGEGAAEPEPFNPGAGQFVPPGEMLEAGGAADQPVP